MSQFFEFEFRLPCRSLTREEIEKEYAGRVTRPIPAGYEPRRKVIHRLNAGGARPFAVFAVDGTGHRRFISSHHSIDAADMKAVFLNDENTDTNLTYISGERKGSRGFAKSKKKEEGNENEEV